MKGFIRVYLSIVFCLVLVASVGHAIDVDSPGGGKMFVTNSTLTGTKPLPTTAQDAAGVVIDVATEAKQDDGITQLTTIAGDTTSIDGKVSTEAKQDNVITQLTIISGDTTSIDGKVSTEAKQDNVITGLSNIEANQTDGTQKAQQVDGAGNVAPAGDTVGRAGFVKFTDGVETMSINANSHGDVVQHSHIDSGAIHFHVDGLTAATYRFIIVDISDTTNYPHVNTNYAHVEWVEIQVDSTQAGTYTINHAFLENVDATDGDRYINKHWSGSNQTGNQILEFFSPYPNGWRMRSESIASAEISLNDTAYQTDVNLPSTLDPSSADTPSGSGDIVLEIVVSAGEIDMSFDMGYHSH